MLKLIPFLVAFVPALCFGGDSKDILLGQVISVSSPLVGEISSELKSGYEAYFAELNEQGGIHGRKVRLVQKEDGYVATKTLALTRELIDADKVVALVGYLGTPGLEALVRERVLVERDIALVGPSTGVAKLLAERNVFPYVHRTNPNLLKSSPMQRRCNASRSPLWHGRRARAKCWPRRFPP